MIEADAPESLAVGMSLFPSFFLGGFECSTHRRSDGRRLDLVASTRHDLLAEEDYAALAAHGLLGARDGARWHLIERNPGEYDWASLLPVVRAAKKAGVRVAWDLCHYGYPDHLHPLRDGFEEAMARYAEALACFLLAEEGAPPILCPVNEISFWAWAGGEVAHFNPGLRNRGDALKNRLVMAFLKAGQAARRAVPGTRLIAVDPLIHVMPSRPQDRAIARAQDDSQWGAWDALLGLSRPELGGAPDSFDVMGVNYYWNNQWERQGNAGRTVRIGDPRHRPFRELLLAAYARGRRPLMVAETSVEGAPRAAWLRYIGNEVRAAMRLGTPIQGICLYPVISHPGWDNDRYCPNGLFEMKPLHGRRPVVAEFAQELRRQQQLFDVFLAGEDVADEGDAAAAFGSVWRNEAKRLGVAESAFSV
ncbi:beta-glucosidase [Roseomonas sp. CGMCC 1.13459]|uniref:beta-glucosidase n=1 Tax=Roseomonas sp. CGMCC 1.13459 TaxID=3317349 RepID=UPI002E7923F0|nr:beta-glucosidase [Roseomonas oleicola]